MVIEIMRSQEQIDKPEGKYMKQVVLQAAFCFALSAVTAPLFNTEVRASAPGLPAQSKDKLESVFSTKPVYSPYANRHFPSLPLFGDTHLHTAMSMDAGTSGTNLGPEDAYRFARHVSRIAGFHRQGSQHQGK